MQYVRNSVLIISHVTFWDCRADIFCDNLSRNKPVPGSTIVGKTGREKKRESLTDWLTAVHFLLHHLHERSYSCPLLLRRIERYSSVPVSCCGWLQALFFSSCDQVSYCRKDRDAVPVLCYRANDLLVADVEAIPSTSKHFQSTAKFNSRVRCVMTKSVSNFSWENSSRWFRNINLFVCRFPISFFLF